MPASQPPSKTGLAASQATTPPSPCKPTPIITQKFALRQRIRNQEMEEDCVRKTIEHMHIPDEEKYLRLNRISSLRTLLGIAFEDGKSSDARKYYYELKRMNKADYKCFIKGFFTGSKVVHLAINLLKRLG